MCHEDGQGASKTECSKLTCKEVLLGVDEVVRGFVHLNFTLPALGQVPHPGITGIDVKLKTKTMVRNRSK